MKLLIVSTSLNPACKSQCLAVACGAQFARLKIEVELIDLRNNVLPLFDGADETGSAPVHALKTAAQRADGILLTGPIYSWSLAASSKNAAEWIGDAFHRKVVGFAAVSGGMRAYLAPLGLLGSIMIDQESHNVPKILLVDSTGFDANGVTPDTEIRAAEFVNLFRETLSIRSARTGSGDISFRPLESAVRPLPFVLDPTADENPSR